MRRLLRRLAHARMKRKGLAHVNRSGSIVNLGNGKTEKTNDSFFSQHWREYIKE